MPVFQDLQQITTMLGGQFGQTPVIEDQDFGFGERSQELGISAVALGDRQFLQQSGQAQILDGVPLWSANIKRALSNRFTTVRLSSVER